MYRYDANTSKTKDDGYKALLKSIINLSFVSKNTLKSIYETDSVDRSTNEKMSKIRKKLKEENISPFLIVLTSKSINAPLLMSNMASLEDYPGQILKVSKTDILTPSNVHVHGNAPIQTYGIEYVYLMNNHLCDFKTKLADMKQHFKKDSSLYRVLNDEQLKQICRISSFYSGISTDKMNCVINFEALCSNTDCNISNDIGINWINETYIHTNIQDIENKLAFMRRDNPMAYALYMHLIQQLKHKNHDLLNELVSIDEEIVLSSEGQKGGKSSEVREGRIGMGIMFQDELIMNQNWEERFQPIDMNDLKFIYDQLPVPEANIMTFSNLMTSKTPVAGTTSKKLENDLTSITSETNTHPIELNPYFKLSLTKRANVKGSQELKHLVSYLMDMNLIFVPNIDAKYIKPIYPVCLMQLY